MTTTISRVYDDHEAAVRAVQDLEAAGLPSGEISIIANNSDNWYGRDGSRKTRMVDRDGDGVDDRTEAAEGGAGIGALLGGTAGLLAGLGVIAIPGIGPVVAAGWLAAAATGVVAGGAAGGIVGALTQAGVSDEEAPAYAEAVRRGGTLVSARVPDADRARYAAILDRSAVNIRERADSYRQSGWKTFDANAKPYDVDQAQAEREAYRGQETPR